MSSLLLGIERNVPILAKLTPNVTRIDEIAKGAADGGADAVCLINTVLGSRSIGDVANRCWATAWAA